jgi:membrane fusion protein, multidrug efflux system
MMMTSRRLAPLAGTALLLVLAGCGEKKQPAPPPVPVSVAPVARGPVPYELQATGTVEPMQTVAVVPQVSGRIMQVAFREGQTVAAGEVLFQIDPRPYQAALAQARAMVARDRATATNAEAEANRYSGLVQKEYVTPQQYDQVRATAAAARATVSASEAAYEQARLNAQYATIRAPIGGQTGSLLVREGNLVQPNGPPLVTINQIRPTLVRFAVPAANLAAIQQARSRATLPVQVVPTSANLMQPAPTNGVLGDTASSAGAIAGDMPGAAARAAAAAATNGESSAGTLTFMDNAVDTTTGTILLKGTFPNSGGTLWPGEFVNVRLRLSIDTATTVPAAAVVSGQQGSYVFVVAQDGTAQQRTVRVLRTQGDIAIVDGDLKAGERVVTDGQLRLRPGSKVQIKGAPAGDSAAHGGTS